MHLSEIPKTALSRLLQSPKDVLSMEHQLSVYASDLYVCETSDILLTHWTNCMCSINNQMIQTA